MASFVLRGAGVGLQMDAGCAVSGARMRCVCGAAALSREKAIPAGAGLKLSFTVQITLLPVPSNLTLSHTSAGCQSPRSPAVQGVADVFLSACPAADPTRLISSAPSCLEHRHRRPLCHPAPGQFNHTTILLQPQVRGRLHPSPRDSAPLPSPAVASWSSPAAAPTLHFR